MYEQRTIVICTENAEATEAGICPAGSSASYTTAYVAVENPSTPGQEAWEFWGIAFGTIVAIWAISRALGELINFVRRV